MEKMKRFGLISSVLIVLAFSVGCARAPKPTGYLDSFLALQPQPKPLQSVYAERTRAGRARRVDHILLVMPSRWDAERFRLPSQEAELLEFLDLRLFVHLLRHMPDSTIVTRDRNVSDFLEAGANVTQLRLSITDYKRGIGIVRMLLGFKIAPAEIQIEGRLTDLKSGATLAAFARRAASDGAVWGLATPQSLSPTYCWRLAIDETASYLAYYTAQEITPPPPKWWELLEMSEPAIPPHDDTTP